MLLAPDDRERQLATVKKETKTEQSHRGMKFGKSYTSPVIGYPAFRAGGKIE
ncbi:MAG: hypothetical protein MSA49_04300 [Clostridia bacterium]|nr:hypothetical protein [Clostridia bacterium]